MATSSSVYAAVAAGQSAEEVRRAIDACAAPGDEQGRAAAVNEAPLQLAHRLRRADLVALLLEEGADSSKVLGHQRRPTTALALCVCYDLPETLRALLRKGGHDANQRLMYYYDDLPAASDNGCTLLHECVDPPRLAAIDFLGPTWLPRLACLEALVREGGASVDARDERGRTPLHWAASKTLRDGAAVVELLVRLGADANARDETGTTPIFECVARSDAAMLRRLLEHGALPDVANERGYTPLMLACVTIRSAESSNHALQLLRCSSPETRRAVYTCRGAPSEGFSAVDFIARARGEMLLPLETDSIAELIAKLLASGAPVLPQHAARVLPVAVSHGLPLAAQRQAELSRRPAELCSSWPAHEAFAGLAMDVGELRAAESEVEAKRRRVLELEMELVALGCGTESSSSGGEEGESDESESESGSGSDEDERGRGRGRERRGVSLKTQQSASTLSTHSK